MATTARTKKANPKKTAQKTASVKAPASSPGTDPALLEFFCDEIKDIYWAEKHLTKALPKMQKAASSSVLADAIGDHLEVTKTHVKRLEQIFEMLGKKPQAKKCDAMEGISKEGEGIVEDTDDGTATRDVGLIMASQKVEHYEIATYGGLSQLAGILGLDEIKALLDQTLEEEKETDRLLTEIAENDINYEAAEEE